MKRHLLAPFAALLLLAAAGCDTYDDERGTHIFTHTVDFDLDDAAINGNVASVQYEVADITRNAVRNGVVLAFFREQDTWTAMPYTYAVDNPQLQAVDYTITLGYAFEERFLEVFYEASTAEIDLDDQPDRVIRIVVIEDFGPGKTGIDLTDYAQVRAHFGLPD